MHLQWYEVETQDHFTYEFDSVGPKGIIRKSVSFQLRGRISDNFYNLSLKDWDDNLQIFVDDRVSNNSDTKKILATIAKIVDHFFTLEPAAIIQFTGSTQVRNRLYRMNIMPVLEEISVSFTIWGEINGEFRHLEKDVDYVSFLIFGKIG